MSCCRCVDFLVRLLNSPFVLMSALLLLTLSQLEFFDATTPVELGLFRRKPKRVLRYGAPVDSFLGGDRRGVDRPVLSANVSRDSTAKRNKTKRCQTKKETSNKNHRRFICMCAEEDSPEFPLLSPIQQLLSTFNAFAFVTFKSLLLLSLD